MVEVEFEQKILITKNEFDLTLDKLSEYFQRAHQQINYYYDTPSFFLFSQNNTLRVRQKKEGLRLEYKYEKSNVNNIRSAKEYSYELQSLPEKIFLTSMSYPTGLDLHQMGSMLTERHCFRKDNMDIFLDTSWYLGKIDYEIEIEYETNDNPSAGHELLGTLPINSAKLPLGKYSRFVHQYKKITTTENVCLNN